MHRLLCVLLLGLILGLSSEARAECGCVRTPLLRGPTISLLPPLRCTPCQERSEPASQENRCEYCAQLQDQVLRGCQTSRDDYSPYADSLFARHDLAGRFSEGARTRMIAATLAQDPDVAAEATAELRASRDATERYAGNLVSAYATLRSDRADRAALMKPNVAAMSEDAAESGLPPADLSYLRALIALDDGHAADADAALEQAIGHEPRFFSALALSVQLQLGAAMEATLADGRTCLGHYRTLMLRMQRIMELAPCLSFAAHLEIFLARRLRNPGEQSAFNVVQVYLALVSRRLALAQKRIEKFEYSNATCRAPVALELKNWLEVVSKLAATP